MKIDLKPLLDPKVQGALRHFLSMVGPIITIFLAVDEPLELLYRILETQNWIAIVGIIMAFLALIASWKAPEKKKDSE